MDEYPAIAQILPDDSETSGPRAGRLAAVLAAATANALWGSSFLLGKIALAEMTPLQVIQGRFLIATLVLLPLALRRWRPLSARDAAWFALSGFLMIPVMMLLQFEGLSRTSATSAALIIGAIPVLLALAAVLVDRERLGPRGWVAVMVSTIGAVLLAGAPGEGRTLTGDVLVLLSAVAAVAWVLVSRRLLVRFGSLLTTALSITSGTLWLLPVTLVADEPVDLTLQAPTWAALLGLGILCSVITYSLWNWALQHTSASRLAPFVNLEPVVGALLGVLVLHETPSAALAVGGALVLSAAFLASTSSKAD